MSPNTIALNSVGDGSTACGRAARHHRGGVDCRRVALLEGAEQPPGGDVAVPQVDDRNLTRTFLLYVGVELLGIVAVIATVFFLSFATVALLARALGGITSDYDEVFGAAAEEADAPSRRSSSSRSRSTRSSRSMRSITYPASCSRRPSRGSAAGWCGAVC